MKTARIVLIGVGVLGLALGAVVLMMKQDLSGILGVAAWMIGAIVLHDAVISPIVFGVSVVVRRAGRGVSRVMLLIVQGAVIVGSILTLLVVPEIYAKGLTPANDTVLPFDYAARLGFMWLGLAVLTVGVCLVYSRVHRSKRVHPSEEASTARS